MFALTLSACSKNDDSDPDPQSGKETTVNFKNELEIPLTKMMVGIYKGSSVKLAKNYGTLAIGASTGDIVINDDDDILQLFVYFEDDDGVYYSSPGFLIDKGQKKTFNIGRSTSFLKIDKTSFMYPK
ncbi:MAG: hypothetical protein ABS46_04010 [Cytophagaceae bacterium SCN 52-12]|nr:MAG: hypothetical protein ABS46_04010 [Cytophagaceae bacterium SCN 52-12]